MHMKTAHRVMLPQGPPGSEIGDLSTWCSGGSLPASLGDLQPSDYEHTLAMWGKQSVKTATFSLLVILTHT